MEFEELSAMAAQGEASSPPPPLETSGPLESDEAFVPEDVGRSEVEVVAVAAEEDIAVVAAAEEDIAVGAAEDDGGDGGGGGGGTEFPVSKVKKIVKMDRDVKKVNSEALLLIRLASQRFLRSLADKAAEAAVEKKRKTVNLDHLRSAVRRHPPTSCFLLDSLPLPQPGPSAPKAKSAAAPDIQLSDPPAGTRRIDDFFLKK